MPLPIQIERLARAFVRVLGLQGYVPLSVIEDVQPMLSIPVDEDAWRWNQGERRFGQFISSVAVVGQFSQIIFGNPVGTGVLAILERLAVTGAAGGGGVFIGPTAQQPPYTNSLAPLDQRSPYATAVPSRSASGMRALSNAATMLGDPVDVTLAGYTVFPRPGIILPPGSAFGVEGAIVNSAISSSVWWREYPMAPQENVG